MEGCLWWESLSYFNSPLMPIMLALFAIPGMAKGAMRLRSLMSSRGFPRFLHAQLLQGFLPVNWWEDLGKSVGYLLVGVAVAQLKVVLFIQQVTYGCYVHTMNTVAMAKLDRILVTYYLDNSLIILFKEAFDVCLE